jgi:hypothetical protein
MAPSTIVSFVTPDSSAGTTTLDFLARLKGEVFCLDGSGGVWFAGGFLGSELVTHELQIVWFCNKTTEIPCGTVMLERR